MSREQRPSVISKETLIPIGLVITIAAGIWGLSALNSRVLYDSSRIDKVEDRLTDTPTRAEFDTLRDDIKEIKEDIKKILNQI